MYTIVRSGTRHEKFVFEQKLMKSMKKIIAIITIFMVMTSGGFGDNILSVVLY